MELEEMQTDGSARIYLIEVNIYKVYTKRRVYTK